MKTNETTEEREAVQFQVMSPLRYLHYFVPDTDLLNLINLSSPGKLLRSQHKLKSFEVP
jgi:hypothetical protein